MSGEAIHNDLRAHYHRCHTELTRLRMIMHSDLPGPLPAETAADVGKTVGRLVAELCSAARTVAGQPPSRSTELFLDRRLTRLDHSATDVLAAAAARDAALMRRLLQQFCALAAATWKVQLSLHAPAAGRSPRPARTIAADRLHPVAR